MATATQIKDLQTRLDSTFGKGKVKSNEETWANNKAALDTMEAAGKVPILDPSGTVRGTDAVLKTAEVYTDVTSEYKDLLAHLSGEEGYNPNFYLDGSGILTTGVGLTAEYVADPSPLRAMTEKTNEAKSRVPKYARLHPQVQLALVDSAYRGDLTNTNKDTGVVTSQKWVDHVNNGDFRKAAVEHINHNEYNKAKGITGVNRGLIPRFDWRAAALKRSAEPQLIQQMQDRSQSIYDQREDAAMLNGMGSGFTTDKVPESNIFSDAFDSVQDSVEGIIDQMFSTGEVPKEKVSPTTTQDIPVPEQGATVPKAENKMATQAQVNSYLKKRNAKPDVIAGMERTMPPVIDNDIPSVANGGVFGEQARKMQQPLGVVDQGLMNSLGYQTMGTVDQGLMNSLGYQVPPNRQQASQLNIAPPQGTVDQGLMSALGYQSAVKEPAAVAYPSKQSHMDNILQQTQLNLLKNGGDGYHYDKNGKMVITMSPHLQNPAIPMGTVISGNGQPIVSSNGSMVGSPTQNPAYKAPAGGKGANATPQSAVDQLTGVKGFGGK